MDDFITIEDLADYMNVDQLLQTSADIAIAAAQQLVRKYLDQEITFHAGDVEWHDGTGHRHLRLRQRPVRKVVSVTVDDVDLTEDEWFLRGARLTMVNGVWPSGTNNVKVVYDHGWDVTETSGGDTLLVPADIKLVTLNIARRKYVEMGEDDRRGRISSERIGDYSYTVDERQKFRSEQALLTTEMTVLDRYAVRLVP